jgi:hypothetical protein
LAALLRKHYVTKPASMRVNWRDVKNFTNLILNFYTMPFQLNRSSFSTQSNLLIFCFTQ